jgi:flagellin
MVSQTGSLTAGTALTDTDTSVFTFGGKTVTFTAGATSTVGDLINYLNDPATGQGLNAYIASTGANSGKLIVQDTTNGANVAFDPSSTETVLGNFSNVSVAGAATTDIYLSDSTSTGASVISVNIGAILSSALNYGSSTVDISGDSLTGVDDATGIANAKTTLGHINAAIGNVAGIRGDIGAGINRLQSAVTVMQNQTQNLSAAEDGIRAADIASEVANLTKYSILNQTGISALAQANQMQQSVLSLLK